MRVKNDSGISAPSNIIGPVTVKQDTFVDELADFTKMQTHTGGWKLADRECRSAKEDAQRVAGVTGDVLIYQLPTDIKSFRVFTFFPKTESDVEFSISADGQNFHKVAAQKETYFHGAGEYAYWQPVLFHAEHISGGNFLKLELTSETQIDRIEIIHDAKP